MISSTINQRISEEKENIRKELTQKFNQVINSQQTEIDSLKLSLSQIQEENEQEQQKTVSIKEGGDEESPEQQPSYILHNKSTTKSGDKLRTYGSMQEVQHEVEQEIEGEEEQDVENEEEEGEEEQEDDGA